MAKDFKLNFLLGIFVTSLILANILGTKITTLFGIRASFGIFVFPILFLVTDIVAEVHGKIVARNFVYVAIAMLLFTIIMTVLAIALPVNDAWDNQVAFASIFGASLRIMIASVIAFAISQLHDVWSFEIIKKKTKGKHLWFRNNLSTFISQFIDTTLFMFIAFYQVAPKFTAGFVWSLIIPYWLLKVGFAAIDTPFVYLGVKWLKK